MPFDRTFYNYGKGFNIYRNLSIQWDSMVLMPREHHHRFMIFWLMHIVTVVSNSFNFCHSITTINLAIWICLYVATEFIWSYKAFFFYVFDCFFLRLFCLFCLMFLSLFRFVLLFFFFFFFVCFFLGEGGGVHVHRNSLFLSMSCPLILFCSFVLIFTSTTITSVIIIPWTKRDVFRIEILRIWLTLAWRYLDMLSSWYLWIIIMIIIGCLCYKC